MKALVYTAPRRLELQELAVPEIRSSEVRVKVRAAAVCGSDLHGFLGRSKRRVPPLVLGHEFSGEVADSSDGAFTRGDAVAVYPIISCGACRYCASDRENPAHRNACSTDSRCTAVWPNTSARRRIVFCSRLPVLACASRRLAGRAPHNAVHVLKRCPEWARPVCLIYGAGPYLACYARSLPDISARRVSPLSTQSAPSKQNASTGRRSHNQRLC